MFLILISAHKSLISKTLNLTPGPESADLVESGMSFACSQLTLVDVALTLWTKDRLLPGSDHSVPP